MVGLMTMLKRFLKLFPIVLITSLALAKINFEQVAFDAGNLRNIEDLS